MAWFLLSTLAIGGLGFSLGYLFAKEITVTIEDNKNC